jgi:phosphoribosylformylglycinamidine synthase II
MSIESTVSPMTVRSEPFAGEPESSGLTPEQTRQLALEWGLTAAEYERITEGLGRLPTVTEVAMFSVEWCEHCGYPKSRRLLGLLPKTSRRCRVLVGADTGGFYLTDDLAVVMKVESHNHPSQVEPLQGAATGVGGIIRDIFTVGARPIASGNSLRFGELSDPYTRYLLNGVVRGISAYGNSIGVPTVAGEVQFHPSYRGNCLVNALAVGIAPVDQLTSAAASGPGNPVLYVGSRTGRDGIGGCSVLASHEFGEGEEKRPTVQIGDPFTEKCLIEACLEAVASGHVVAMKDMGAAGVTCTTSEMAAEGGVGMRVHLDRIPRREAGMQPYEVMMSESQERMLLVAERGHEETLRAIFRKWDLNAVVVGEVTDDGMLTILDDSAVVAHLSAEFLTSPPRYEMPVEEPAYLAATRAADLASLPEPADKGEVLLRLLASPNVASKRWVWEQYDHTVQANTVAGPGGDAAVLRLKAGEPRFGREADSGGGRAPGPTLGLALTLDGNSRRCYLDPFEGARQAVAEAARNLSCVGAEPMIVTDGLNFGNPDKPDRYWQFRSCVEGIAEACRQLDLAVVSGNVSFYNESPEGPIHPTPIIGMLGVLPDVSRAVGTAFRDDGDIVLLLGDVAPAGPASLGGSEYLAVVHGREAGRIPPLDIDLERRLQAAVRDLIRRDLVRSAHDCADGGLAVALAECAIAGRRGARIHLPASPNAAALFGEAPSRILITVSPDAKDPVLTLLSEAEVPAIVLGRVTDGADVACTLTVGGAFSLLVSTLEEAWEQPLPAAMNG